MVSFPVLCSTGRRCLTEIVHGTDTRPSDISSLSARCFSTVQIIYFPRYRRAESRAPVKEKSEIRASLDPGASSPFLSRSERRNRTAKGDRRFSFRTRRCESHWQIFRRSWFTCCEMHRDHDFGLFLSFLPLCSFTGRRICAYKMKTYTVFQKFARASEDTRYQENRVDLFQSKLYPSLDYCWESWNDESQQMWLVLSSLDTYE